MNPSKSMCFAHRHLTFAEYGLWSHLREVSYKSNPRHTYRFDDRTLAERFAQERGCSKDTVNRLRRSLARKGFVAWIEPQKRDGGRYAPRLGRILSHEEWAELHPGKCIHSALEGDNAPVSNGAIHQSQVANHQSQLKPHQSQTEASPVSNNASHQSQQRDISLIDKSIKATPLLSGMASAENFSEVIFTPSDSANHQSHSDASLILDTGDELPVSAMRQNDPLELTFVDGQWRTAFGVPVLGDTLALILDKEMTA